MTRNTTTTDPNVPHLPELPEGGGRWKVKYSDNDEHGYGGFYDLKVCLQFRSWLGFWFSYVSRPVRKVSGQTLARSVELTAEQVLEDTVKKARDDLARKKVKGVYRTGNY